MGYTANSYEAEEGMTWAQWIESNYNTDGYFLENGSGRVMHPSGYYPVALNTTTSTVIPNTDTIINGHTYVLSV